MNQSYTGVTDVNALETEVDRNRADLSRTLNAVEEKFSPDRLLRQTVEYLQHNGSDVARSFGRSLKDNPVPLLLTGVGIAWMMASSSSAGRSGGMRNDNRSDHRSSYRDDFDNDYRDDYRRDFGADYRSDYGDDSYAFSDSMETEGLGSVSSGSSWDEGRDASTVPASAYESDYGSTGERNWRNRASEARAALSTRVGRLRQDAGESSEDWQHRVERSMREIQHAAYTAGRRARQQGRELGDWFQEQPLAAGALGVAVGAMLGSMLPSTRTEDRLIGDRADAVRDYAGERASTMAHQAEDRIKGMAADTRRKAEDKLDEMSTKAGKTEHTRTEDQSSTA